jgi:hypothetical protein
MADSAQASLYELRGRLILVAQAGERDADRLCDYALAKLREADGRSSQLQSSSEARAASLKPGPRASRP